jgi:hypothetical protein
MASSDKIVSALDSLTDQLTQMVGFQQAQIQVSEQQTRAFEAMATGNTDMPSTPMPTPLSTPVVGVQTPGAPMTSSPLLLPTSVASNNPQIMTINQSRGGNATPLSGPQPMANGQLPGGISPNASVPTNYQSQYQSPLGGSLLNEGQAQALNGQDNDPANQAITMAMLGEHGAPGPIRNMIMGSYGMTRSLEWAQNGSSGLAQSLGNSNMIPNSIANYNEETGAAGGALGRAVNAIQKPLEAALAHPLAAYIGSQAISNIVGNIDSHAKTATTIGSSFGYSGNPIAGPRAAAGLINPLANYTSAASREGYSYDLMVNQAEGRLPGSFGQGLTSTQAKSAADVIGNQGFQNDPATASNVFKLQSPTGNAENLMQGLFKPLMNAMPGLDASSIGEFTDSIRNAGASTDQVRMELTTLGQIAQATGQNVNALATATANAGQTFEAMGSSSLGGAEAATAYQSITGIQGGFQMAAQLAQSPFVQGMNMSTYGVLPSAMGDENPGAFAQSSTDAIKMLAQATKGLNHNVYRNVDGIRTLISSGQSQQVDQIASMLNIPKNQVQAALDPGAQRGTAARINLQELIGGAANGGTGMFHDLESGGAKGRAEFNQDWAKIQNHIAGTGISQARLAQIDKIKDPLKRLGTLNNAIAGTSQNPRDKVSQNNNSAGTTKVEFTGAAARWFQTVGTSQTPAKKMANAGQNGLYASTVNNPAGDPNLSAATSAAAASAALSSVQNSAQYNSLGG